MNKVLSIVIPAYNVDSYLNETLSSCVIPNAEMRRLYEVVIINDGSTDKTKEVAEEYVNKYSDTGTFRLINKENGGYGSAVNCGISNARGMYFKILDGDDWYNTEALSYLIVGLQNSTSDLIITNYTVVDDSTGEKVNHMCCLTENKELNIKADNIPPELMSMHRLCIRIDILKENNIKLTENCFYTDNEYVLYAIPFIKTVMYYPIDVYQYRVGRSGQSISFEGIFKHIDDLEVVIDNVNNYFMDKLLCTNNELIEKRISLLYKFYIDSILSLTSSRENKNRLKKFIKNIKKNFPERYIYIKSKKIRLLEMSNYLLYRPCHMWHKKMECR